jgi:outer membrane protein OmpA-like peptidoglycan-associated protein
MLLAVCALTSAASAGNAPAGPDFQSPRAHAADTAMAASDGRAALDPIDVIPFSFDSAKLDSISKIQVREVASWMTAHPDYQLVVAGHTDAAGGDLYNFELAARRVKVVRDELERCGISRARVVPAVYGKAMRPSRDPYAAANRVAVLYATRAAPASALSTNSGPDLIDVFAEAMGQLVR